MAITIYPPTTIDLSTVNIEDIRIENPTENQHLELCKHFKETVAKKNFKIERMSKAMAVVYGLVTLLSTDLCPVILHHTHNYLEQEIEWLLDLED
tara:strand:- start:377 stop:661 length:285 start_codon:yes stop_codon:yes gene_type:complete